MVAWCCTYLAPLYLAPLFFNAYVFPLTSVRNASKNINKSQDRDRRIYIPELAFLRMRAKASPLVYDTTPRDVYLSMNYSLHIATWTKNMNLHAYCKSLYTWENPRISLLSNDSDCAWGWCSWEQSSGNTRVCICSRSPSFFAYRLVLWQELEL